jgi:hypothetical protein
VGKRIEDPAFLVQQGKGMSALMSAVAEAPRHEPRQAPLRPRQKPLPRPTKPIPRVAKKKKVLTNGKVVRGHKLRPIVDDEAYTTGLRDEACIFTGLHGTENDPVEAMHIGNCGKNVKSANEALPARHSIHALTHTKEGILAIIPYLIANPHLLIDAFRALAREKYAIERQGVAVVPIELARFRELVELGILKVAA